MGVDASKANDYGWTPLSVASFHGHLPLVKFLLENTSQNSNAATIFGFSPLM